MTRTLFRASDTVGLGLLTLDDLPFLLTNMNDVEMTEYLEGGRFPLSAEREAEWVKHLYAESPKALSFGIVPLPGEDIIGTMGLHGINLLHGTASTGAWIGKEHRNKKLGREAKMVLLRYAFIELGLRTIESCVLSHNERSYRYLLATGYREVGRNKAWRRNPMTGEYVDEIFMQLMKEDWLPLYNEWRL